MLPENVESEKAANFKLIKKKPSLSAQSKHFISAVSESFTLIEPVLYEREGRRGDLPGAAPAYIPL